MGKPGCPDLDGRKSGLAARSQPACRRIEYSPYYYVLNYEGNSVAEAKATHEYSKYGVFYNWPAAMGYQAGTQGSLNMFVQGACPDGWHLPSQQEWQDLLNYLADNGYGFNEIVDDVAKSLAAKTDWASSSHPASPGYNPDTNNQSGFTGLPAGNVWFDRDYPGKFDSFSYNCRWWSSKSLGADWSVIANLYVQYTGLVIEPFEVKSGVCVRCLKN